MPGGYADDPEALTGVPVQDLGVVAGNGLRPADESHLLRTALTVDEAAGLREPAPWELPEHPADDGHTLVVGAELQ